MMLSILMLAGGMVLLIGGADWLVRGVAALAAAAGISPLVIGLTVVAFGTSTPELVVNVLAASRHQTDLAFGNVVGSCSINIGFVLALTALIRPLTVEPSVITREIPMMLLGVFSMLVMSFDVVLNGATSDTLSRGDGLLLLMLFCVFLYYITRTALNKRETDAFVAQSQQEISRRSERTTSANALMAVVGLIGLSIGASMTVSGAVAVARTLGVSETIIGLTIISFGTTLPELTTCLLAARRGQGDIAVGNIIGSNIFNVLCVGGLVSSLHPMRIPFGGRIDLLFMAAQSALLLPVAIRGPRKVTRMEGAFLLITYLVYLGFRAATSQSGPAL